MTEPDVLQIAPNDHPPFADLLETYRLALTTIGATVETRVLAEPRGEPVPGCDYLGLTDLSKVGAAAKALKSSVSGLPRLALCHRYRSYRVLRASRLAVPRVVTIAHEFGFFRRLQRRLERHLFARNVIFAGVSPAVQADLAETVPDPICLPNALDLDALRQQILERPAALARLGVADSEALTVGLVGRLVDKKSPQLAIEALRCLQARHENVRLLVIGDGPLRRELEALAAGLPVIFCGFVPEARRLLAGLDLLLLTSKDVEAFGMVALEAMCAGVPVVAGPTPGPQFVLGSTGFYYNQREPEEIAEAIIAVRDAKGADMLSERLDRATERLEREFSVPALARRLQALV
jgi:glycosyltransferase involved in cell wall biosynthesis